MKKNVGIYIDVPNLWAGTKNDGVKIVPKAIKRYGASFGKVKIAQTYLNTPAKNAGRLANYMTVWWCEGFEIKWRSGNGKNGIKKDIDPWICPHMIDDLHKKDIDVFVLVSGDSDFEEAVKIIKRNGKKVIIIAPSQKCAARSLIESADEHIFYRDLMERHETESDVK